MRTSRGCLYDLVKAKQRTGWSPSGSKPRRCKKAPGRGPIGATFLDQQCDQFWSKNSSICFHMAQAEITILPLADGCLVWDAKKQRVTQSRETYAGYLLLAVVQESLQPHDHREYKYKYTRPHNSRQIHTSDLFDELHRDIPIAVGELGVLGLRSFCVRCAVRLRVVVTLM